MKEICKDVPNGTISGRCEEDFDAVAEAFERNFVERDEVGASVCVKIDGRTVVDLWGGRVKPKEETPWTENTVSVVFSSTKGATALCAHVLADRGDLDLDAPVADYWPEFARNGKEGATVRMMLDHSVGVPANRDELPKGSVYDWDYMCGRLAEEEAFWEPGKRHGYHGLTFGWTVGELVRRVSGKSLGAFFQDEVAKPLGIDFWIGLPESEEQRVAPVIPFVPGPDTIPTPFVQEVLADKKGTPALFLFNQGGFNPNSRDGRAAELGAANGVTNARGLAGMYAPLACGGSVNGTNLVSLDTVARMGQVSMASHRDETLVVPTRFALGFMKSMDNRHVGPDLSCILSEPAFGHVGAGGSIGFADPSCSLSFGYTMNRMGQGILLNDRGQSLIDAVYSTLGFRSRAGGVWMR